MSWSLASFIGRGNALGQPIPIGEAGDHIAGYCLLNDWSARDLQAWEYQPLGPFLAKNFLTSISPWVVTPEALAPFRTADAAAAGGRSRSRCPISSTPPTATRGGLGIQLEVTLVDRDRCAMRACRPMCSARASADAAMYWSAAQIVTHHASNGCNLHAGRPDRHRHAVDRSDERPGSLLEISRGGKQPIELPAARRAASSRMATN